ncbi:MAG: ribonuclease P protein component [Candidatus Paceibacterota bacterium]|jgi:ribonuclease P protein component
MLPKSRRLSAPLLSLAFKKSQLFSADHLSLRVHRLASAEKDKPTVVAIVAPAKVNPRAVDRHLSKRKISACLEKDLNLIKPGQYLIFQIKKDITKLKSAALINEIENLLNLL